MHAQTEALGDIFESIIRSTPEKIHAEVAKVPYGKDLDTYLLERGRADELQYRERYVTAADFKENHVRAMFQTLPTHASPLSINLASNTMLKSLGGEEFTLAVTNHPMKSGLNSLLEKVTPNPRAASTLPLLYALVIPLGLSTLAAGFIVFPLEERLCRVSWESGSIFLSFGLLAYRRMVKFLGKTTANNDWNQHICLLDVFLHVGSLPCYYAWCSHGCILPDSRGGLRVYDGEWRM